MHETYVHEVIDRLLSEGETVPSIRWNQNSHQPIELTISLVCHYQKKVGKFFYDMVSQWLIPGKELDVRYNFSSQCVKKKNSLIVCEMVVRLENQEDLALALKNFPFLQKEIRVGTSSLFHAKKILEMKGLAIDDKTSLIQEKIHSLVKRFPTQFEHDIFNQMQYLLISFNETFKAIHKTSEICRIIFTLYIFKKQLENKILKQKGKRHICVKIKKILLHTPLGLKEVLSLFVSLNFLTEHECFEERHLLSAVSHFFPEVRNLPGSFYSLEGQENSQIQGFYMEIEKEKPFTKGEINLLKKRLKEEIRLRIEHLVPPVFMPRNEEEVMRNILVLSHEIKSSKDLPQMIISFDEQTDVELSFTVILVRLIHSDSRSIAELFRKSPLSENLSIDRTKVVGSLRRKIPKEAAVLRVRLSSRKFLRQDFSVDLYRARLHLVLEIQKMIGEVRDYNGGMITKQRENFQLLKENLGNLSKNHPVLLQNFFHAIFPAQLSTTLDPQLLKILFHMLLDAFKNPEEKMILKSKTASDYLFMMIKIHDISLKKRIFSRIESLEIPSNELLTVEMQLYDAFYLGFIYLDPEKNKQGKFLEEVPKAFSCSIHSRG